VDSTYFHNITYLGIDVPRLLNIRVEPQVYRNRTDCVIDVCDVYGQDGEIIFESDSEQLLFLVISVSYMYIKM